MISIRAKFIIGLTVFLAAPSVLAEENDCVNGGNVPRYSKQRKLPCAPAGKSALAAAPSDDGVPLSGIGASQIMANPTLKSDERLVRLKKLMSKYEVSADLRGRSLEEKSKDENWREINSRVQGARLELEAALADKKQQIQLLGEEMETIQSAAALSITVDSIRSLPRNVRELLTVVANKGDLNSLKRNSDEALARELTREDFKAAYEESMTKRKELEAEAQTVTEILVAPEGTNREPSRAPAVVESRSFAADRAHSR